MPCNFRNIEQIRIKSGTNQSHFIVNIVTIESTWGNCGAI